MDTWVDTSQDGWTLNMGGHFNMGGTEDGWILHGWTLHMMSNIFMTWLDISQDWMETSQDGWTFHNMTGHIRQDWMDTSSTWVDTSQDMCRLHTF